MNMTKAKKQGPSSITACISRFLKEPAKDRKRRRERDFVMGLFNDYLAGYGEVESNVERDPLIVTAPISDLRPGHFRLFLTWFVIRKVMDRNKSQYAPVLREFADWLKRSKAISGSVSKEIFEALDELRGEPERCEELATLLYRFANRDMPSYAEWKRDPKGYARKAAVLKAIHHKRPREVVEGYFTVARIGPGAFWLSREGEDGDAAEEIGPLQVPPEAAKLARVGDRLCAELGLMDGFWKLLETGGVYPD